MAPDTEGADATSEQDTLRSLLRLRHDVDILQLQGVSSALTHEAPSPHPDLQETLLRASALGLEAAAFRTALNNQVRLERDQQGASPRDLIQARIDEIVAELAKVPATTRKAREWLQAIARDDTDQAPGYEAFVALVDELSSAMIDRIANMWRAAWQEHRQHPDPLTRSEIFWVSRDGEDLFDDLAHYGFYEHFALGEFGTLFAELERQFGVRLLDLASALDPFGTYPGPDAGARNAAQTVWLISRSQQLPVVLADVIGLVLRGLIHAGSHDGSWPSPIERDEDTAGSYLPDTVATAAAVISLLKLSSGDEHHQRAARGVDWLLQHQFADGHWPAYGPDLKAGDTILGSALALEAIVRSGRPNLERATARAAAWLVAAQHPAGGWQERSLPSTLLTVVILDALDLWHANRKALAEPLVLARDLIRRSERLVHEDSAEARQLAVIAAHAGIEAFLYAVLEHPDVAITTIRSRQTIGLRDALGQLQGHYQAQGLLQNNAVLAHRDGVDRIAYLRDEVVHKALPVSPAAIEPRLTTARHFVSAVSRQIFGHDLLDG